MLPDGRSGWVPKSVCQHVEDPQARRQNMKNFLLSEEAQRAYQKRKQQEKRVDMFVRVHDVRDTSVWVGVTPIKVRLHLNPSSMPSSFPPPPASS